jgi:membrane protein
MSLAFKRTACAWGAKIRNAIRLSAATSGETTAGWACPLPLAPLAPRSPCAGAGACAQAREVIRRNAVIAVRLPILCFIVSPRFDGAHHTFSFIIQTMQLSSVGTVLKKTARGWYRDGALDRAAILSYCAVFAIAPLLVIITLLVGLVHSGNTLEQVRSQFVDFISPEAAALVARGVVHINATREKGIGYTVFAVLMLVIGASAFTYELQRAVDAMWHVVPRPGRSVWKAMLHRLWTLVLGVGAGIFLQLSVVLNSEAAAYRRYVNALLPGFEGIWHYIDNAVSFLVITILYLLSYKILPRSPKEVTLWDAFVGSFVAAVLFIAGRWVVALYMFRGGFTTIYGAAGSLMILLTWLYYCSLVFLFGAKLTRTLVDESK